jgi:hypothetical protein
MSREKTFEVRFYLKEEFAKALRQGQDLPELKPLKDVLTRHDVGVHNQLDEFQSFLTKLQKIENWEQEVQDPDHRLFLRELEEFTLKTVLDDSKREYLGREFSVEPKNGPYKGSEADRLIKDLQALEPFNLFAKGAAKTEKGVRKVYRPKKHPGTTGPNPDIFRGF